MYAILLSCIFKFNHLHVRVASEFHVTLTVMQQYPPSAEFDYIVVFSSIVTFTLQQPCFSLRKSTPRLAPTHLLYALQHLHAPSAQLGLTSTLRTPLPQPSDLQHSLFKLYIWLQRSTPTLTFNAPPMYFTWTAVIKASVVADQSTKRSHNR